MSTKSARDREAIADSVRWAEYEAKLASEGLSPIGGDPRGHGLPNADTVPVECLPGFFAELDDVTDGYAESDRWRVEYSNGQPVRLIRSVSWHELMRDDLATRGTYALPGSAGRNMAGEKITRVPAWREGRVMPDLIAERRTPGGSLISRYSQVDERRAALLSRLAEMRAKGNAVRSERAKVRREEQAAVKAARAEQRRIERETAKQTRNRELRERREAARARMREIVADGNAAIVMATKDHL